MSIAPDPKILTPGDTAVIPLRLNALLRTIISVLNNVSLPLPGASGRVLTSNGTVWTSAVPALPPSAAYAGDNSGDFTPPTTGVLTAIPGYTVTLPAAVGDVLELELTGTVVGPASSTVCYTLMAFFVNGVDDGRHAGTLLISPTTNAPYQVMVHRVRHTVVLSDIVAGNVSVAAYFSGTAAGCKWVNSGGLVGLLTAKKV